MARIVAVSALFLRAADLQREPAPVDQQPDHDLRVDPAFLGVADLAQVVFLLRLEVQRRHLVETQGDVPTGHRMGETRCGDPVAVVPIRAGAGQGALHRRVAGRAPTQIGQDPPGVQQRRGFHHPGDHQIGEHRIAGRVEPQPVVHAGQRLVEQPGVGRQHPPGPSRTTVRDGRGGSNNNPGGPGSPTNDVTAGVSSTSKPRRPCAGSSSSWRARSSSTPSSASVCADPTCLTIR